MEEYIYKEFGRKLLDYKNSRKELISKIKTLFKNIDMSLPKLEEGELIDIDPFTIFALFNKKIKFENRIKIITSIKKEFENPNFKYHDYITLSYDAFITADRINKENKEKRKK